ncbi:MAG TPA: hypothetical protein VLU25_18440 [Acidobacteriota bacterium]|nr:hypothetical protein [Acidobacteriota bacterium]
MKSFQQYEGWSVNEGNLSTETREVDGEEVEVRKTLNDDSVLYLQENYVVTDGIFKDENIVFEEVTPEWTRFCSDILHFEIPADLSTEDDVERGDNGEGKD